MSIEEIIKESVIRKRIDENQREIKLLKGLLDDLKQMNEIKPIDFGFVECMLWEYISGREWEIKQLPKQGIIKNKNMFIFDIDGCILPSIFPKLLKKNQTPNEQDQIIKDINEGGYKIGLYPNFIEFYFKNCSRKLVYFVTGRKRSNFEKLTYHHLSALQYENIYFYPEDGAYEEESYLKWKLETIRDLLQIGHFHHVFDDMNGYFETLKTVHGCRCYQVQNEKDWDLLNFIFKKKKEAGQ